MNIEQRIAALVQLGKQLLMPDNNRETVIRRAIADNAWFTQPNIQHAIDAIATQFLAEQALRKWIQRYNIADTTTPKKVGIVLAGNIPLVGFHDLLCIFAAGHKAQIKVSSKDTVLINYVIMLLNQIDPQTTDYWQVTERLHDFDAVIATGSNNSSRYFEYYFGKYPHIIRRNRSAVAVLSGNETDVELVALGNDVFSYFGLGCRNISKLFVPTGYVFDRLLDQWQLFDELMLHDKYKANYDYQRTLLLLNREVHFASDYVMIRKYADAVSSPVSVVYYETYDTLPQLKQRIEQLNEQIQCVVGSNELYSPCVDFGKAQYPALNDYADGIDVMQFLQQAINNL